MSAERVWYVNPDDGVLLDGRLIRGGSDASTSRLLVGLSRSGRAGMQTVDATYSPGKQRGTWHYQGKPS